MLKEKGFGTNDSYPAQFGRINNLCRDNRLKDPETIHGKTFVLALIIDIQDETFLARIPGEANNSNIFKGKTEWLQLNDSVQA